MKFRQWISAGIFFCALGSAFAVTGPQPANPNALVPAEVRNAKSVFLSNAGLDAVSAWNGLLNTPEQAFSLLSQSMQAWGRYQLAAAPADADMVFTLKIESGMLANFAGAVLHLTISDTKTGVTLWTVVVPLESSGSGKVPASVQNLMQSVQALVK